MKLPENILPLIDGDWIVYMACSAIEYPLMQEWKKAVGEAEERGLSSPPEPTPNFQDIVDVFEYKVKEIKLELETEARPLLFYTGTNNFRKELAVSKTYKGNRSEERPYFYEDLKNYIEARYSTKTVDNLEADDLMAVTQGIYERWNKVDSDNTVTCIVTVDKDLRQVDGWHYSPEGHNFGSWGPRYCDNSNSFIEPKDFNKIGKGLVGSGFRFFYSQLITGDTVDNIPGLPRHGPAAALKILGGCASEAECYEAVRDAYRDICLMADDYLLEQARLLWMIRGYDDDGNIIHWTPPVVV